MMYNNDDDGWTNPLFVVPFEVPEEEKLDTKAFHIICPKCGTVVDGYLDSEIVEGVQSGETDSITCPISYCKRMFDVEYDPASGLFETWM